MKIGLESSKTTVLVENRGTDKNTKTGKGPTVNVLVDNSSHWEYSTPSHHGGDGFLQILEIHSCV